MKNLIVITIAVLCICYLIEFGLPGPEEKIELGKFLNFMLEQLRELSEVTDKLSEPGVKITIICGMALLAVDIVRGIVR